MEYKGLRAEAWGYFEHYEKVLDEIALLPRIRVLCKTWHRAALAKIAKRAQPRVVWEGVSIAALQHKFPRTLFGDSLAPQNEDGELFREVWFERQTAGGGWERIPDPRQAEPSSIRIVG